MIHTSSSCEILHLVRGNDGALLLCKRILDSASNGFNFLRIDVDMFSLVDDGMVERLNLDFTAVDSIQTLLQESEDRARMIVVRIMD
jgi:hypothetical protein